MMNKHFNSCSLLLHSFYGSILSWTLLGHLHWLQNHQQTTLCIGHQLVEGLYYGLANYLMVDINLQMQATDNVALKLPVLYTVAFWCLMLTLSLALVLSFEGRFLFDHFLFRRRGIEVAFILIINDGKLWDFTVCLTMRIFQML